MLGRKPGAVNKLPEDYEVPKEARHTYRGLIRWLEARRERGVPEEGYAPAEKFHGCSEGCILHDHMK